MPVREARAVRSPRARGRKHAGRATGTAPPRLPSRSRSRRAIVRSEALAYPSFRGIVWRRELRGETAQAGWESSRVLLQALRPAAIRASARACGEAERAAQGRW